MFFSWSARLLAIVTFIAYAPLTAIEFIRAFGGPITIPQFMSPNAIIAAFCFSIAIGTLSEISFSLRRSS
jgi:hypothetical protein